MYEHDAKLSKLQSDFKKFYDENLAEDYARLERFRVCHLAIFVFCLCCFINIFLFIFNWFSKDGWSEDETEFIIEIIGIGGLFCSIPVIWFGRITKINVMDKVVSFFDGMKYGKDSIDSEDLMKSDLFDFFTGYYAVDCMSGSYKDVDISVSEIILSRYTMPAKKSTIIYKGVVIKLDIDKSNVGKTVGYYKPDRKMKVETILITLFFLIPILIATLFFREYIIPSCIPLMFYGIVLICGLSQKRMKNNRNDKEYVRLEDVVFSEKWEVYANDQINARYILTPALMERLLEIKSMFRGENVEFSFFDNKLLISLPCANMFETTSLFSSTLKYNKIRKFVSEFYCIFSIIEILKLENKKLKRR